MRLKKFKNYNTNEDFTFPDVEKDLETPEIKNPIKNSPVEEEEEEGHQYDGTRKMNELAKKLGTKVTNNYIDYKGVKINFFSEDEHFHIGKKKFKEVQDVLNFLQKDNLTESFRNKRFK